MRLADKVQEWLDQNEWTDVIDRNEENQKSQLNTTYGINNQSFDLYIETEEQKDWLLLYLYAPFNALPDKYKDCMTLFNRINANNFSGAFCLTTSGKIQFRQSIDIENSDPSPKTIENMLNFGSSLIDHWFDEIASVALTKKTVQEVFAELDGLSVDEEEVPDSI
jgi:hypothetical protein